MEFFFISISIFLSSILQSGSSQSDYNPDCSYCNKDCSIYYKYGDRFPKCVQAQVYCDCPKIYTKRPIIGLMGIIVGLSLCVYLCRAYCRKQHSGRAINSREHTGPIQPTFSSNSPSSTTIIRNQQESHSPHIVQMQQQQVQQSHQFDAPPSYEEIFGKTGIINNF